MMLKLFLPLIAAMKAGARGSDGWSLGVQVAQAYKGCKAELNRPTEQQSSSDS